MALNKLKFNSLNVTPTAGKTVGFNSSADGLEPTLEGGAMRFISKSTASSSSTISFTSGIDSTYKEYLFIFKDIHPATNAVNFTFQAYHGEGGGSPTLAYGSDKDQAQGTGFQVLMQPIGNGNDESGSGYLHIFNPSSSVFVKHFIGRSHYYNDGDYAQSLFTAGYFNTTTALTRFQFKMSSGNIDAGTITLYGIN